MAGESLSVQFQQAVAHHQAGRLAEAERGYREILRQDPRWAPALHYLGLIGWQAGRPLVAIPLLEQALALLPNEPELLSNLGEVYRSVGRAGAAHDLFRRALALNPRQPGLNNNFGTVLVDAGHREEAVAYFAAEIGLQPTAFAPRLNLANTLFQLNRVPEALAAYEQARQLNPDDPGLLTGMGCALRASGQLDAALTMLEHAAQRDPRSADAHCNLGLARFDVGRVEDAERHLREAVALRPDDAATHSNLVFLLNSHPDAGPAEIAAEQSRWRERHTAGLAMATTHSNDTDPERRLRVGYVSPDFYGHALGFNLVPLFRNHSGAVEIFCYADVRKRDVVTTELQAHARVWRETQTRSDAELADLVRADGIDVLVDLTLHSPNNRLLAFARKPAPVQVTFAGYPGSTGLKAIDYRLTDPFLDPPGMFDAFCSEKIVRLPHSFWCYDSFDDSPVNPLPALTNKHITFGCLNTFNKVNRRVLVLWTRVLRHVPDSRLVLLLGEGGARQYVREILAAEDVDPSRVVFVARQPRKDYFKLYHTIDVCLDSFPYNGHTTSLDAFWMGVPVVTLVGTTIVGRAGWSQLSNLGLTELAARTPEEFVAIAGGLATDRTRLGQLRETLRARMTASPLTNAAGFARAIETAYRHAWRQWCAR